MLIYSGKRYTAERAGEVVVQVECDRCQCEYFYVLARVGIGHEIAPYGIGSDRARRSAAKQSSNELTQRLVSEAELVPCPKCHWINDSMIEGYRRSRFRFLGQWAIAIAMGGTILSLVVARFFSIGHARDRGSAGFFLYWGPVLCILLGGSLVLLRNLLRQCIVPNRDMPSGMRIPEGSPPALVRDANSGELALASPPRERRQNEGPWIFPLAHLRFPPVCCGCLQQPTSDRFNYECEISQAIRTEIPRCGSCARSDEQRRRKILAGIMICLQLMSAGVIYWRVPANDFWLFNGAALIAGGMIGFYSAKLFGAPVRVLDHDHSRGRVKLWFRNAAYGQIVADHIGPNY